MVWSSVERGEGWVGGRATEGCSLHSQNCLTCGLMLKLLPLMTESVVILNHLGVIHLSRPQKNDQICDPHPVNSQKRTIDLFLKNKRIYRHVTHFKTFPSPFHVDIINVWSLTSLLWYKFFSVLEKITILLFEWDKPIIKILLKDKSKL